MLQQAHGQNDQRFKDLLSEVREIARTQAMGARGRAVLFGRMVYAAANGVIDTEKDKHGKGIDDAKFLYEEHVKAYSVKDKSDHTPAGVKVNVSKVRRAIEFGQQVAVDPVVVFERAASFYHEARKVDPKGVRPEFEFYVEMARMQLRQSDTPLTDEQIKEVIGKPEPKSKELADAWGAIRKSVEALVTGENRSKLKDQSQEAIDIQGFIASYHSTLTLVRERDEAEAKLAAATAELAKLYVGRETNDAANDSE